MPSRSILALALGVTAAFAAPSIPGRIARPLEGREADGCADTLGDQPYVTDIGFYSDADCTEKIDYVCVYTYQSVIDAGSGNYGCNPGLLPDTTPFYAKVEDSPYGGMEIVFTQDQSCPPSGPGAVFVTMIDNSKCVLFNLGGDAPGIAIYPNGGSPLARVEHETVKRDDPSCSGFTIDSQQTSESPSIQVSNIVDCLNGGDAGCSIDVGEEHTTSVTTSMSLSAGGGIEGIFDIGATFGVEYTESSTSSIVEGYSVPGGQKGYLTAYSAATLFTGTFTGCDSGDAEQPGQVLAIKENGFSYLVVLTGT